MRRAWGASGYRHGKRKCRDFVVVQGGAYNYRVLTNSTPDECKESIRRSGSHGEDCRQPCGLEHRRLVSVPEVNVFFGYYRLYERENISS